MPCFTLPQTATSGLKPALRSHLADALDPAGAFTLKRNANKKGGIASADHNVLAVERAEGGTLEETSLTLAPRALQDRCGGVAFALMGDWALFEDIRCAMQERAWFQDWSIYHLAGGAIVCPTNPAQALLELRHGYGLDTFEPRVIEGVFAALVATDLSNHERLHLIPAITALVNDLVGDASQVLADDQQAALSGLEIEIQG